MFLSISEWTAKKVIFGNPILQQHKGIFQIDDPAQTGSHLQPHFSPLSPTLGVVLLQLKELMESEQFSHLYTDIMCGHEAKYFDSASTHAPFCTHPHSACDAILFFIFCSNANRSLQRKSGKNLSFSCDNAIIGKIKRYNRRYQFNGILTIVIAAFTSTSVRNPASGSFHQIESIHIERETFMCHARRCSYRYLSSGIPRISESHSCWN